MDEFDPAEPAPKPAVVMWFKIYCIFMVLMYLACIALGPLFLLVNPRDLEMDAVQAKIYGIVFIAIGIPCLLLHVVPLFLRPRPGAWTFDLIIICLGMTGCFCRRVWRC